MSTRPSLVSLAHPGWVAVLVLLTANPPAQAQPAQRPRHPANRLAKETSPYLLLHAHNPVDWYPWGPEAFAKAKAEGKPIFLSVGYSACYWCHVMERECFMDAAIAKKLNDGFVCIKVDREERPDVDQIYMTALQVFGRGGWPMSMFLTSDGRPFFGGTYFPPADREGIEGFPSILNRVLEAWRDHKPEIEKDADRLSALVRRSSALAASRGRVALSRKLAEGGREALTEQFDPEYGGFGFNPENARRPKFPEPVNLVFLLDQHRRDVAAGKGKARSKTDPPGPLEMVVSTMDHMARGGIRDQLAGGYHRYATSRYWIVPHFEKMLYDNAQLASAHLTAFDVTGDPRWRREAEDTFAFIARSMTAPEGGFYSALDAETEGEEGKSYVWSLDEVKQILGEGPDFEAFTQVYGQKRPPNFEGDRYVLLEPRTREEQAKTLKTTAEALEAQLAPIRKKMLAAREKRPAPLCDDKILTSWNGLMIAAYADGFRVLKDPSYREVAEKAADFLLTHLRDSDGRLLRTYRAGRAKLPAYLEDYAFLAHGLLRLHAATGDPKRLAQARVLTDRMIADFDDTKLGGFFYTADDHESLIARPKDPLDNVIPSGNSVAVRNLVALASLTKEPRYLEVAGKTLDAFSDHLAQSPGSLPLMMVALGEYLDARSSVQAAPAPSGASASSLNMVAVKAEPTKPAEVTRGGSFEVAVSLAVNPGWHIYANPSGVEGVSPTRVALGTGQGAALEKVDYPPGERKQLASSGSERVAVYEGKVTLGVHVRIDTEAKPGPRTLKLTLHYQACDERSCVAPARMEVEVPVTVVE
jgi:uncharacterized protein YyaL (SSP411 family)